VRNYRLICTAWTRKCRLVAIREQAIAAIENALVDLKAKALGIRCTKCSVVTVLRPVAAILCRIAEHGGSDMACHIKGMMVRYDQLVGPMLKKRRRRGWSEAESQGLKTKSSLRGQET